MIEGRFHYKKANICLIVNQKAEEFISHDEILKALKYGEDNKIIKI